MDRKNFVIGYIPGLTRATGLTSSSGEDLLNGWMMRIAKRSGNGDWINLATKYPDHFSDCMIRFKGAVIFLFTEGTLAMFSRQSKPSLPPQMIDYLVKAGVTGETPVAWYRSIESAAPEEHRAKSVLVGIPSTPGAGLVSEPPSALEFESVADEIVDKLLD